jgi:hypothetical protein
MNRMMRLKFFLWYFSHVKVPLIGYVKPSLISLTDTEIIIKLPLRKRTKNHLNSMYFGALSIGADLAGGFHGLYHAKKMNTDVSLAFKSFKAQFLKRAESDVYFVSHQGDTIRNMIIESNQMSKRINQLIHVKAYVNFFEKPEEVAYFNLELSLKVVACD